MDSCLAAQEGNVNHYLSTKEFRFPLRFVSHSINCLKKLIILMLNKGVLHCTSLLLVNVTAADIEDHEAIVGTNLKHVF